MKQRVNSSNLIAINENDNSEENEGDESPEEL
jgi:hypothetical protein